MVPVRAMKGFDVNNKLNYYTSKKKKKIQAGFEIRQKSVKKYFNVPKNEATI